MLVNSDSIHTVAVNLGIEDSSKIPSGLNRAIHAQVLAWLQTGNPEISALVHNSQRSPISISDLIGNRKQLITRANLERSPNRNKIYFLVNFLQGNLVTIFLKGIEHQLGNSISLGNNNFTLVGIDALAGTDSQARSTTYKELYEKNCDFSEIKLKLLSPTSFKQNNCIQPFPLPELVFSNLLRRWNTFAPEEYQFPQIDWQGMTAAYDLKTQVIKKEVAEIGSLGWVKYEFKDAEQAKIATTLANFSNYSGIGRKTALGMGRVLFQSTVNSQQSTVNS